jgi:hypothetical protein
MTAEFESFTEMLLVILTVICMVQVIFTGLLLWYMRRVAGILGIARETVRPPLVPSPAPAGEAASAPEAAGKKAEPTPAPVAPAVDIIGESPDIQGSIRRLSEKFRLSDFIITTLDGLVVVSLSPGSSEEAARFSELHRRKKKPDSPGVTFLEIAHRGEAMLGIARSDHPLSGDQLREIDEDARKILNWWL